MTKNLVSNIRLAELKDAKTVARIHLRSWQKMYREFVPDNILKELSVSERAQEWQDQVQKKIKVLVIEVEAKIVGFVSLCRFGEWTPEGDAGEIKAIYLHPDYWRKGLGAKLGQAAIEELKHSGCKKVCLWVLEGNIQAQQFYRALGFEASDQTRLKEFYEGSALLTEILYQKII